jgi:hypothetical protein
MSMCRIKLDNEMITQHNKSIVLLLQNFFDHLNVQNKLGQ